MAASSDMTVAHCGHFRESTAEQRAAKRQKREVNVLDQPLSVIKIIMSFMEFTNIWEDRLVVRLVLLGRRFAPIHTYDALIWWRNQQVFARYRYIGMWAPETPDHHGTGWYGDEWDPVHTDCRQRKQSYSMCLMCSHAPKRGTPPLLLDMKTGDRVRKFVQAQVSNPPWADHDTPGVQLWTVNGKLHREGGEPALLDNSYECPVSLWYIDGVVHRTGGGPAIHRRSNDHGSDCWVLRGKPANIGPGGCCRQLSVREGTRWTTTPSNKTTDYKFDPEGLKRIQHRQ